MTKSARTNCSAIIRIFICIVAIVSLGLSNEAATAQSTNPATGWAATPETGLGSPSHFLSVAEPEVEQEGVEPVWRYTRFGWQDANQWTSLNQIVHPPQRGLDRFHPLLLAMLILFGAVASMLWASNEWEVAQLFDSEQTEVRALD